MEYRPELCIIYSITALLVCIIFIVYFFTPIMDLNFKKKNKPKSPLSDTFCFLPLSISK